LLAGNVPVCNDHRTGEIGNIHVQIEVGVPRMWFQAHSVNINVTIKPTKTNLDYIVVLNAR